MANFNTSSKVYVKSNNSVSKINKKYLYTLLAFILYLIIYNIITKDFHDIINIAKTLIITIISGLIVEYLSSLIKKNKSSIDLINTISIALIITLFSYKLSLLISIISTLISIAIKKIFPKINLSSSLYGILFIILYLNFTNNLTTPLTRLHDLHYLGTYDELVKANGSLVSYLYGAFYLSPILSLIIFFYLFHKKSIKYELFLSYILSFTLIMLVFGLIKNMNIYYAFFQITTGNLLFLSIYGLSDSSITPTIGRGQIIYGIILGTITAILRFIIPELSVIIALIIGPIILTKPIDKISTKLKYNDKYWTTTIYLCLFLVIITIAISYLLIK